MPLAGWQNQKIGELFASSLSGDWGREGDADTGVPVLRSTNFVDDGSIDYTDIAFRSVAKGRLESRKIGVGTILIEKAGGSSTRPAGRVVYCDRAFNGTASNFVEIVHVKKELEPKFVFYLLFFNFHAGLVYKYQQQTTGIINFKLREYCSETVELPRTQTEQAKIAEILSAVDFAIAQSERLISKQERIKSGLIHDLVTRGIDDQAHLRSETTHKFKDSCVGRIPIEWCDKSLTQCADRVVVGLASSTTHAYRDEGIPMIRNQNIRKGYFDDQEMLKLDPSFVAAFPNKAVRAGDVLTVRTGANVGDTAVVPDRYAGSPTFTTLITSTKRSILLPKYLELYVQSHLGQAELNRILVGGGKENLNVGQFVRFRIAVPPPTEQERAIAILDAARSRTAADIALLEKLRQLRVALMQDLLMGRRRVTAFLSEPVRAMA